MIMGWPVVSFLNLLRSSGRRQGKLLALPIAIFFEWATIMLMCGNIMPSIMSQYEIEIKSLLGSSERAEKLKEKIRKKGGVLLNSNKQLNHYFIINDVGRLKQKLGSRIARRDQTSFNKILKEGSNFSVRTRDTDGKVLLVIKASIGQDTSANGISRMEFESEMKMTLDDLDQLLLDLGLKYQAKWSWSKSSKKNAGYGYLAEFEK